MRLQGGLGLLLALAILAGSGALAAFWHTPRLASYFRIAALIPLFYAVYAVLRRFGERPAPFPYAGQLRRRLLDDEDDPAGRPGGRLSASPDAFVGFVAAAAFILIVALARDAPAGGGEPFPSAPDRAVRGGGLAYTILLEPGPQLRSAAAAPLRAGSRRASTRRPQPSVAGNYEALRTFAILPYQSLLVVTFVIFPLVSRATFAADRDATRAYVSQTMRYALILAGAMGIVLAARPSALFGIIYKPECARGAAALPILVAGQCCLALLSVACSILNAARTNARDADC